MQCILYIIETHEDNSSYLEIFTLIGLLAFILWCPRASLCYFLRTQMSLSQNTNDSSEYLPHQHLWIAISKFPYSDQFTLS